MQLIVDEGASEAQRQAVVSITTAEHGGLPWEIFSSICPHKREPVPGAITFEMDRERRTGTIRVPGIAEVDVEPIKNPVTGDEHRAGSCCQKASSTKRPRWATPLRSRRPHLIH